MMEKLQRLFKAHTAISLITLISLVPALTKGKESVHLCLGPVSNAQPGVYMGDKSQVHVDKLIVHWYHGWLN